MGSGRRARARLRRPDLSPPSAADGSPASTSGCWRPWRRIPTRRTTSGFVARRATNAGGVGALGTATAASAPGGRSGSQHAVRRAVAARPRRRRALSGDPATYGELDRRADRLARGCAAWASGRRSRVAVCCLEPSPVELVVALLAVLKAGGAYVPLDPATRGRACPGEDRGAVRRHRGRGGCATVSSGAGRLSPGCAEGVPEDGGARAGTAGRCRQPGLRHLHLGLDRRPKGVAVAKPRAWRGWCVDTDYVHLAPGDRWGRPSTPAFDAADFRDLGRPLERRRDRGAARVAPALAACELAETCAASGCQTLFLTTALWPGGLIARRGPGAFGRGRARCSSAARPLIRAPVERDPRALAPPERLLHVYGPTESTTFATWDEVTAVRLGRRDGPHRPADRRHPAPVVDAHLRAAAAAGRARRAATSAAPAWPAATGGRPELTAERFVPDPFAGEAGRAPLPHRRPGAPAARTAQLEFLAASTTRSRSAASASSRARSRPRSPPHPAVREAAVRLVEAAPATAGSSPGCVAARLRASSAAMLRAAPRRHGCRSTWCRRPSCVLDALPLPPTARSTARALPRSTGARTPPAAGLPSPAAHAGSRSCSPASGPRCWASSGSASTTTSSTSAATRSSPPRSLSRVRDALRRRAAAARRCSRRPTVGAGRAARARRAAARGDPSGDRRRSCAGRRAGGRCRSPSPSSGSGSSTSSSPASPAYNMPRRPRATGRRARPWPRLQRALAEIVRRHEALRTTFVGRGGEPVQVILPAPAASPLPVVDLAGLPERPARGGARALGAAEAPPARSTSAQGRCCAPRCCGSATASTSLLADHAPHRLATAGRWASWSRELRRSTAPSPRRQRPRRCRALPIQYADFAAWQRALAAGRGARGASSPAGAAARRRAAGARAAHRPAAAGRSRAIAARARAGAPCRRRSPPALRRLWRGARARRCS